MGRLFRQITRSYSFVTTPIFYVNGPPHIGHLYTSLLADTYRRWNVLKEPSGEHIFVTGSDEHGSKIARTARASGAQPQAFCDQMSDSFRSLCSTFNVQHTHFVRTTSEQHRQAVEAMWVRLRNTGAICKAKYEGWYSVVDEAFYMEDAVEERDVNGQKHKVAKETGSRVEWAEEENYMFNLAMFRERVRYWISTGSVSPSTFGNLALHYVDGEDLLSVSRDRRRVDWGIPVPGDPTQTIYVWLDALVSYMSATKQSNPSLWPPTCQIIGKDILKFHAVYWPSFLLAADLPLPKCLFVHGHWLVEGSKMSKSVGNVVDPFELSSFLTTEGLRYFLLKQGVAHEDNNFSLAEAVNAVNADLVNNIGNLLSRSTVSKLNSHQQYHSPDTLHPNIKQAAGALIEDLETLRDRVAPLYDRLRFYKGLEEIMGVSKTANALFQVAAPWKMNEGDELSSLLYVVYETLRVCSTLLLPIVPNFASHSLRRLGVDSRGNLLSTAKFAEGKEKKKKRTLGSDEGPFMNRIQRRP